MFNIAIAALIGATYAKKGPIPTDYQKWPAFDTAVAPAT